jgi:hypothetical protein
MHPNHCARACVCAGARRRRLTRPLALCVVCREEAPTSWPTPRACSRTRPASSARRFVFVPHTSSCVNTDSSASVCAQEENILHRLKPEPGMALVFNHMILHEGERVQSGMKYIMRSVRLPGVSPTYSHACDRDQPRPHCPCYVPCRTSSTSASMARNAW